MRLWYLDDYARLAAEREGITQLQHCSTHVQNVEWMLSECQLGFKAIIRVNGHDYPIELVYPNL